jgi:tripartite-type tricarboxylate transporter receptor subunit TctC
MSSPIGDYLPYSRRASCALLAISGPDRSTFVPDMPTFREQRLPITVREWYGLFLPAKASAQMVNARRRLRADRAVADRTSLPAWPSSAWRCSPPRRKSSRDLLKADADEWRRLIKQIGFTAES